MNQIINFLDATLIWVLILTIPYLWLKNKKYISIRTLLSGLFGWFIAHLIKNIYPTTRPYISQGINALVSNPPTTGAFPSAHTTTAFAIATSIYLYNKQLGVISYILAILIGLLRILGRVHYPLDILGGAIIGILITLTISSSPRKLTLWWNQIKSKTKHSTQQNKF